MTNNKGFVDELYNQFLVCHLCGDVYTRPKSLNCLHTFCEDCLEKYHDEIEERPYRFLRYSRALSCPLCRTKTDIPDGGIRRFPDNFLIASLMGVIGRRRSQYDGVFCDICDLKANDESKHEAVFKCLDCSKHLCAPCAKLHSSTRVTEKHSLFNIQTDKSIDCKIHEDEELKFYCEQCESCVCILCTFHEHRDHEISPLGEGVRKARDEISRKLESCKEQSRILQEQISLIDRCETVINTAEEQIQLMTQRSIEAAKMREQEMLEDLRRSYGDEVYRFVGEKSRMLEQSERIESISRLSDTLLVNTSIELLMVKEEVRQRLEAVLDYKNLPVPEKLNSPPVLVFASNATEHTTRIMTIAELQRDVGTNTVEPQVAVKCDVACMTDNEEVTVEDKSESVINISEKRMRERATNLATVIQSNTTANCKTVGKIKALQNEFLTNQEKTPGKIFQTTKKNNVVFQAKSTQTEVKQFRENFTSMPQIIKVDKETPGLYLHFVNKNICTDSQVTEDKCTSAAVDVTAVYRGLTNNLPSAINRGTNTPKTIMLSKGTLAKRIYSVDKMTSPIDWNELR